MYICIYVYMYIYISEEKQTRKHKLMPCRTRREKQKHACSNPGANHGLFRLYSALQILAFQIELCEKSFGQGLVWPLISVAFYMFLIAPLFLTKGRVQRTSPKDESKGLVSSSVVLPT